MTASGTFPSTWRGRHGDPQVRVQQAVDFLLTDRIKPRILEAGCGSLTRVELPQDRVLAGIDIEQRQLDRNTDLDEKILGDLQEFPAPIPGFDLVICWDVIEHLPHPVAALERMTAALTPGGGLVMAFPNLWSLKGLITKFTPYSFHLLFYRLVARQRDATQNQFPTYLRVAMAPHRLRDWAHMNGYQILYDEIYEGSVQTYLRQRHRILDFAFAALGSVSRFLSAGRVDLGLSDCILVLRAPK